MDRAAAERNGPQAHTGGWLVEVRAAVEGVRESSGADIVALYPYDEDSDSFYAPLVTGLPEEDVGHALPDLSDQLRRFRADEAEGKVPPDLSVASYGPSAWLLTTRRTLVSTDPRTEVGSSFVRRHRVQAMVGLPLVVGKNLIGLLYLDYVERPGGHDQIDVSSAAYVQKVEHAASELALAIDASRQAEETRILRDVGALVGRVAELPAGPEDPEASSQRIDDVLRRVLAASGLGCVALYLLDPGGGRLRLVAAKGCPLLSSRAASIPAGGLTEAHQDIAEFFELPVNRPTFRVFARFS